MEKTQRLRRSSTGQEQLHPPAAGSKAASYEVLAERLEGASRRFGEELAAKLLPALKEEMRSGARPHDRYADKCALVRWVNAELRRFNLAFSHPRTNKPAALKAQPGYHPEIGNFELRGKDADGRHRTFTAPDLDTLLDNLVLVRRS